MADNLVWWIIPAAFLVFAGEEPDSAIKKVREVEPAAIEALSQVEFLRQLSENYTRDTLT